MDEALLHTLYAGDDTALVLLAERLDMSLVRVAHVILNVRTGIPEMNEWDIDERVISV